MTSGTEKSDATSPGEIIDHGRMGWRQWLIVGMMVFLNALDGFDVLSVAFAGPGIRKEFSLDPNGLGAVLSMELAGMAAGSMLLGGLADRIGRRPVILGCLTIMTLGMFAAATAGSPQSLSGWRLVTGFGIGGLLASINAVAFDYASLKWRNFVMAIVVIGYPLGAFLGGQVVGVLLESYDWRAIFVFGGAMTAICVPLIFLVVPEPPGWLASARPIDALDRINRTLKAMGHRSLARLDAIPLKRRARRSPRYFCRPIFAPRFSRRSVTPMRIGISCGCINDLCHCCCPLNAGQFLTG